MKMDSKNQNKFGKLDFKKYSGKCVGLVDGKVAFENNDPEKVLKKLMAQKHNKEISLVCVPKDKTTMAI